MIEVLSSFNCSPNTFFVSVDVMDAFLESAQRRLETKDIHLIGAGNSAGQAAMFDHLSNGRFIMGVGPGGLSSDFALFDVVDKDRKAMMVEALDMMLAMWTTKPPYSLKGKYWNITTERTQILEIGQGCIPKPLQKPHPHIIVAVTAPFSKGVTEAAARGWDPLSANFLMPQWVKSHWGKYVAGCEQGGFDDALELGMFHGRGEHQDSASTSASAATDLVRT